MGRNRFKHRPVEVGSVGPYIKVPFGIIDRRKTKTIPEKGESRAMHVERREAGENKGQRPMAEIMMNANCEGTQMGNEIGNYKGLSHPVPVPNNKGTDPHCTQMGKKMNCNEGESPHITEIDSERNYGQNKRANLPNTIIRPKAEEEEVFIDYKNEFAYYSKARPKAEEIQPYESESSSITYIRPKAEPEENKAYTFGDNLSARTSYDPSDPNLGNAAQTCGNCAVDPFTGQKVANDVRMDEGRILMMKSSPKNQSRQEDDESLELSRTVLIPMEREEISRLITHHLRTRPGLEAGDRQGHEIDRCRGSIRKVSPVPKEWSSNTKFFTMVILLELA
jgi:hypothetical protein